MSDLKFYNVEELEEMLGVTKRTIYRYIKEGKLDGVKLGKEWRFTAEEIKAFMETMRQANKA